jgi:hypothetical protein
MPSPNVAMSTGGQKHCPDGVVNTGDDTCKSSERRDRSIGLKHFGKSDLLTQTRNMDVVGIMLAIQGGGEDCAMNVLLTDMIPACILS